MPKKATPKRDLSLALRELLEAGLVASHEEICHALAQQGFVLSQSKVSRLLHKLGAIKVGGVKGPGSYRLPYQHRLAHECADSNAQSSISQLVIGINASDVLIVVHTTPAAAALVARVIDQERGELGILGCVAGDDTILVVPHTSSLVKQVLQKIKTLLLV